MRTWVDDFRLMEWRALNLLPRDQLERLIIVLIQFNYNKHTYIHTYIQNAYEVNKVYNGGGAA